MLISGGSGITPFISIFREIIHQSTKSSSHLPRVIFISVFKNVADLSSLELLLPSSAASVNLSNVHFKIEAYITQETEQAAAVPEKRNKTVTCWFKPNPLDAPISATLGPNSWLWLGAILSSSFVMFLILLAIVTRYYIYPIDQAKKITYQYSYRCLWDMFLSCLCIFISSSVVFLWCKKQNAANTMQVQNSKTSMAESEVESLPHQSIAESTNVHYGSRPDLKSEYFRCNKVSCLKCDRLISFDVVRVAEILFGRDEADVGVLVCGPRSMRHEVAKICSAGLAKNLHFESISFTW